MSIKRAETLLLDLQRQPSFQAALRDPQISGPAFTVSLCFLMLQDIPPTSKDSFPECHIARQANLLCNNARLTNVAFWKQTQGDLKAMYCPLLVKTRTFGRESSVWKLYLKHLQFRMRCFLLKKQFSSEDTACSLGLRLDESQPKQKGSLLLLMDSQALGKRPKEGSSITASV